MTTKSRRKRGFSLIELLIAMVVTLIIMTGAMMMFKKSSDAIFIVAQKAEMQSNARVAVNSIVRDVSRAQSPGRDSTRATFAQKCAFGLREMATWSTLSTPAHRMHSRADRAGKPAQCLIRLSRSSSMATTSRPSVNSAADASP